jgi:hypothetical protein
LFIIFNRMLFDSLLYNKNETHKISFGLMDYILVHTF